MLHTGSVALAKTLRHQDAKRRRYAAVLLAWLVPKVMEVDTLRAISGRGRGAADQDHDKD